MQTPDCSAYPHWPIHSGTHGFFAIRASRSRNSRLGPVHPRNALDQHQRDLNASQSMTAFNDF